MVQKNQPQEIEMDNESKNRPDAQREESQKTPEPELYPEYIPTPFKYKALAALALIVPFGFFIDWGQTFFLSMGWEYISKMLVLAGLILYIVAVGKGAKRIQEWNESR